MSALNKVPRWLQVLIAMAILAVLVWKFALNTGFYYDAIGASILIATGIALTIYRTQRGTPMKPGSGKKEQARKPEGENNLKVNAPGIDPGQEDGPKHDIAAEARPDEPLEVASANAAEPPIPLIDDKSTLTEEEKNELLNAVWYRCENPYCRYTSFLSVHHILEEKDGGTNKLDNLIVLCPYCHDLAHRNDIPEKEMRDWISNREERFKSKPQWHYH